MQKKNLQIKAIEVGREIDLRGLIKGHREWQVLSGAPNYVYFLTRPKRKQGILVLRYGVVVFINSTSKYEKWMMEVLKQYIQEPREYNVEQIRVVIGNDELRVEEGEIWVKNDDERYWEVIGVVLAQSLMLEKYEKQVDEALRDILAVQKQGWLSIWRTGQIINEIRRAIRLQHELVTQIDILDKPDAVWEYGECNKIYEIMVRAYELPERILNIERKVELLKNNVATIIDIVMARRLEVLEVIIVLLILLSIIQGLIK